MSPEHPSEPTAAPKPANRPPSARPMGVRERQIVGEVLRLYSQGWFPMAEGPDQAVEWVQPEERALLPIEQEAFHISRSLRKTLRRTPAEGGFIVRCDTAFGQVIRACGEPRPGREQTWLSPDIIAIFELLHAAGIAHSVECWRPSENLGPERLVGGVYGLAIGGVFAGESMFSRPELGGTDASKVALVHLIHHVRRRGFSIFDAQLVNPHLEQFGVYEVPREEYLQRLEIEAAREVAWGVFEAGLTAGELG